MSNLAANIAQRLLQIKAIKLSPQNPFTWASGKKSPIYCDNRIVLSYPRIRNEVIQGFVEEIQSKKFEKIDGIVGVATAGIAHGALLASALDLPFAYVRSKAKAHGRKNLLEGELPIGAKVVVIEDLISTGGSALNAVDALRNVDIEVLSVGAIFTYGFPDAKKAFEKNNCDFFTLSNYTVLLQEAIKLNYITDSDVEMLQEWRQAHD